MESEQFFFSPPTMWFGMAGAVLLGIGLAVPDRVTRAIAITCATFALFAAVLGITQDAVEWMAVQ